MGIIDEVKKKMSASLEHFKTELKNIRTGRANPAILDNVTVEVYGTQMRLRDIATITSPEPRQLLITPFDVSNNPMIGKAILEANIGYSPIVDAKVVRINVPPMDKQQRQKMVKAIHEMLEDTKVSVRHARREGIDEAKKQKSNSQIPEDEEKRLEKLIQDQTDKYCSEADKVAKEKENEVLTV